MRTTLAALALLAPLPAFAQEDHSMHDMASMPAEATPQDHAAMGHGMPGMDMDPPMPSMRMGGSDHAAGGSGTSLLPQADGPARGVMLSHGDWMVMAHGYVWGVYTDQGGKRGSDEAFVESMAMLSATRDWGGTSLQLRAMGSLEPAMGQRGYPNLFASGETAHGAPLVDRQHPHDLFMELSARVDTEVAADTKLFVYGGPVAEPALGPSAFMHRRSARYFALSPIAHHWFDSSHITYGVVTGGVQTGRVQLEGSWFNGREPDENRWDIDPIRLDSWSVRASWSPSDNWVAQVSTGHLKSPEVTHQGEDEQRTTASLHYSNGPVSTMVAYAAKHRLPGPVLSAFTAEANWDLSRHHSLFGRVENVANDELFPDHADPLHDRKFRVTRFEGGYAYRIPLAGQAELALGGSVAAYAKPSALDAAYGTAPVSYTLFARLALGR
ncbi:hypothetical protein [Sphingomonas azotifigens]|uniref:hypothetical protein n=1 Tax=Sphingomonas azotifigens TaxID=330920 RepID=UPI001FE694AF|nr:hypothetical protein [Sphingomonas azotifigens]